MMICPYCSAENIEGVDECDQCGQPLGDLSLPTPGSPIEHRIGKDRIRVLQPKEPLVVPPEMPLAKVLEILCTLNIGCVLIMEGETPIGIFSERDALTRIGTRAAEFAQRPIADFMTASPEVLSVDDKVAFALQKMDQGGFRHIPILDGARVVGVVSIRDVLKYVSDNLFESAEN